MYSVVKKKNFLPPPNDSPGEIQTSQASSGCDFSNISNENDILHIPDHQFFQCLMDSLVNEETAFLNDFEDNLGFTSMRRHHIEVEEKWDDSVNLSNPEDTVSNRDVEDPYFATVLNPKGKIKIGDTLYQIHKKKVEVYYQDVLVRTSDVIINLDTTIYNVTQTPPEDTALETTGGMTTMGSQFLGCNHYTDNCPIYSHKGDIHFWWNDGTHRVTNNVWSKFWDIYSSAGASVKFEEKTYVNFLWMTFIKWKNVNAPYLRIDWDVKYSKYIYQSRTSDCNYAQTWGKHKISKVFVMAKNDSPGKIMKRVCLHGDFRFAWNNPPYWNRPQIYYLYM